ncbi:hypothetical protein D9M71_535680 [compost metagenome]
MQAEEQQGFAAGQAKAAQQGAGVIAAGGEACGGESHGDAGEQYRGKAGQVQVALGAAQCAADLPIALAGVFQALVGGQARFDGAAVTAQDFVRSAPELAIAHPAAGLHDARGLQVVQVHHDPRGQAVEVTGAVRLVGQYAGKTQGLLPNIDAVTGFQAQGGEQARLGPGFTCLGSAACLFVAIGLRRAPEFATQWIGHVGGLDAGQLDAAVGGDHAGDLHRAGMLQP